jgi:hypothetical protein
LPNDYFDWGASADRFAPLDTVRSADANAAFDGVTAGLDKIPTAAKLAGGYANYAADTGSANAYVVALSTQITALADGLAVRFKAANANTGASTLNVNGLGAVAMVRADGTPLLANDILASMIVEAAYNATSAKFQMVNTSILAAATSAAASAATATTQAGISTTQAGIATTQAGLANTSRVQADADAVATAADRVQTGLDRTAVAADKATVATDKGIVAADKATVATDKGIVAADKAIVAADKATVAADKAAAATSETNAAASASTATNAANVNGTSATSRAITLGLATFTYAEPNRAVVVGMWLQFSSAANVANYMHGQVTGWNSGTQTVTVNITTVGGSGTFADWVISLSGPKGPAGSAANIATDTHAATSKTTPVDDDEIPLADSAASWGLKKLTWANLKATLNSVYMAFVAPGSSGNVLTSNGSAWVSAAPASVFPYLQVRDEKASGTDGGSSSAGVQTRVLNTVVSNTISGASLASNQVTLPAGTYDTKAFAVSSQSNGHLAYLYNVTDAADLLTGSTGYCDSAVGGAGTNSVSSITGRFTLAAAKVIELRHSCENAKATWGLGARSSRGKTEVYALAEFWKVS